MQATSVPSMLPRCSLVVAVDPAQLHEDAMLDNIVHLKLKGEEAVPHVQQLLGEGQASAGGRG